MQRVQKRFDYQAPAEQVAAMVADPAFRDAVCRAQGVLECQVDIRPEGDGMRVRIDATQATEGIPDFAKKIVGNTTKVVQAENWSDAFNAEVSVDIQGAPAKISGTATISPEGENAVEVVDLQVTVKVPLVGGKLETLAASLLSKALDVEYEVGQQYLAERP